MKADESLQKVTTAVPFEQQPRESAKAFAAFREYLEMGPERSMAAVAKKLAKSEQLIRRWGYKYDWTARVKTHAAHLAEIERLAIEGLATEKAVEWVKTHDALKREAWRKGEELMKQCDALLALWKKASRPPGFESLIRGIELAFKLKQFAAGLPSEVKEVHQTFDGKLEIEWEVALRKAYGKPETVVTVEPEALPPKEGE
ncbi:MAG: hypothetical protein ACK4UN_08065 [Limisphaerales bacterium]